MSPASKKKSTAKTTAIKKVSKKKAAKKKVAAENTSKKPPASKSISKKKTAKNKPGTKASQPGKKKVSAEERLKMIAVAAYLKAEKRGFAAGYELDDWNEAEKEIDASLLDE